MEPARDYILAKPIAFQETGSDRHLRDARGVLVTQWGALDLEAVQRHARPVGVLELLEIIIEAVRREMES